jgi:integrase
MPLKIYPKTGKKGRTWHVQGWVKGKYVRRSTGYPVTTQASKASAKQFAAELEVALRNQEDGYTKKQVPTVAEYWRDTYEPVYTEQKKSARVDRYMMAHALPELGSKRLDKVTRSDCERYLNLRRQSMHGQRIPKDGEIVTLKATAEGTVQRERQFLAAVFEKAKADGHIAVNPWRGIKAIPYAVRERLLTKADQAKLLKALSPTYRRWVLFLLGTGLRIAECIGLTPADVDLERRVVKVSAEHAKLGKARVVPLPKALVPVLKRQLKVEGELWPRDQSGLREVLMTACQRAGIGHLSPHDLRHTFGHRWLTGGGDIYTLSKILGNTLGVAEKHYAHLLREDVRKKADAVDLGL